MCTILHLQDDDRLSGGRTKKQPPAVSPKPKPKPQSSVSSSTGGGPQQADQTEQKKRPAKEPISQYDPSNLPPEIARFVNRVRHSYDGSDTSQQAQHSRQSSSEIMRPRNELTTERPVDKSSETHVETSPTYDVPRSSVSPTFDALRVEVSASSHGQVPASAERVTITPEDSGQPRQNTNLSTPQHQNGRPNSAEISPTTGASATVYPEAYSPSAGSKEQDHHSRSTEADSGIGGSAGSGGQQLSSGGAGTGAAGGGSSGLGGMYSYANYRRSSQDKRDQITHQQQQQQLQPKQNQEQQVPKGGQNQQMSWDAETQRAKHEVIQPQSQQQPFTIEEVEDVKTFLRVLPVTIVGGALFGVSLSSNYLQSKLNNVFARFGASETHVDNMEKCYSEITFTHTINHNIISILLIVLHEVTIYPVFHRCFPHLISLQKALIGMLLQLSRVFILMAFEIVSRHKYYQMNSNSTIPCLFHASQGTLNNIFDHRWMAIPDFIASLSSMMCLIGAVEYFSAQVPYFMKGLAVGVTYSSLLLSGAILCISSIPLSNQRLSNIWGASCGFWYALLLIVVEIGMCAILMVLMRWYKKRRRQDILPNEHIFAERYYSTILSDQ